MQDGELKELFGSNEEKKFKLSYSRIAAFDRKGSIELVKKSFVENEGATIGSLTDDLLFEPENIKKLYYKYNGNKPTATLGKLADIILKNYIKVPSKKEVIKIIQNNKFWESIKKIEVLNNKFDTPEFWSYLKAQFASKLKLLITTDDLILSNELKDILLIHKNSKYIFNGKKELISQVKFIMEYRNFLLRGILDILLIDHENKTVQMIDLKTGANPLIEFTKSFIKWRYYIQEAVYMKAFENIQKQFKLEGYKLLPFQFLYISRYEKIPFLFEVSDKWHKAALKGFTTSSGYENKGLEELLDEIRWHVDNKIYGVSKTIYLANGYMKLNDSFIKIKNGN